MQFGTDLRNARADLIETAIASGTLTIRTGAPPANCAAANAGTVLATVAIPADPMTAAANGVKSIAGTWSDAEADATGTAGHFRIHQGATCVAQGVCSAVGGGGDMTLVTTAIVAGQPLNIRTFSTTEGNA